MKKIKETNQSQLSTIIFLFLGSIFFNCSSSDYDNDWKRDNLKGKVRSVKELEYEAIEKFGEIEKGSFNSASETFYNKLGCEIEWKYFTSENELSYKIINKYIDNQRILESNWFRGDGSLMEREVYHYDEEGLLIGKEYYDSDGALDYKYTIEIEYWSNGKKRKESWLGSNQAFIKVLQFDENENEVENLWFDSQVLQKERNQYTYDDNNHLIIHEKYNSDDLLTEKFIFVVNDAGDVLEEDRFKSGVFVIEKEVYEFNEKGEKIERLIYDSDGKLKVKDTFKYGRNGNVEELRSFDPRGVQKYLITYKYDNSGNEVEEHRVFNGIGSETFRRLYDQNNNLIEQVYLSDGRLQTKTSYGYKYDEFSNIFERFIKSNDGSSKDTYKYDEHMRVKEHKSYDGQNNFRLHYSYSYNNNGDVIEENFYDSEGGLKHKIINEYDQNNNLLRIIKIDSLENKMVKEAIEYNDLGNKIFHKYFSDNGELIKLLSFQYNDVGQNVGQKEYGFTSDSTIKKSYKYEYDNQGNWIRRLVYQNDKIQSIQERKIKYY